MFRRRKPIIHQAFQPMCLVRSVLLALVPMWHALQKINAFESRQRQRLFCSCFCCSKWLFRASCTMYNVHPIPKGFQFTKIFGRYQRYFGEILFWCLFFKGHNGNCSYEHIARKKFVIRLTMLRAHSSFVKWIWRKIKRNNSNQISFQQC